MDNMTTMTYTEILKKAKNEGIKTTNNRGKLVNYDTLNRRINSRRNLEDTRKEMTELYRIRGEKLADEIISKGSTVDANDIK
jgi:hypothetical protein